MTSRLQEDKKEKMKNERERKERSLRRLQSFASFSDGNWRRSVVDAKFGKVEERNVKLKRTKSDLNRQLSNRC